MEDTPPGPPSSHAPSSLGTGSASGSGRPSPSPSSPSRPPSLPPSRPPSRPPSLPPSRPPSLPPSRPPSLPPSPPPWVTKVFEQMSAEWIGSQFDELLQSWVELEQSYNFALGDSKLTATDRPVEVQGWIGDGRRRPRTVTNVVTFQTKWWKWWAGLQPKWRGSIMDTPARAPPADADWTCLTVPGQNGMLTVVATLYWWGCAEKKKRQGARSEGWEKAAADVALVLKSLKAA
ncbi:hypothetical protein C8R47DRAFT_983627 [Mycena vitilis]|nr:hypothetical protein C8R47DRAFT_983627 [Mycena vitilis]